MGERFDVGLPGLYLQPGRVAEAVGIAVEIGLQRFVVRVCRVGLGGDRRNERVDDRKNGASDCKWNPSPKSDRRDSSTPPAP